MHTSTFNYRLLAVAGSPTDLGGGDEELGLLDALEISPIDADVLDTEFVLDLEIAEVEDFE